MKITEYYQVDYNEDSCEGRGRQLVAWSGMGSEEALCQFRMAPGVQGDDYQKHIWLVTMQLNDDMSISWIKELMYGYEWDWQEHKHVLIDKLG